MENEKLSEARREAFRGLLDDPTPSVRKALLACFTATGPAAAQFLQEIARGPDRALAHHATRFLAEIRCPDPIAEFRRFIRSLNYELETGLLLLSRTVSPHLDAGRCCAELDRLAARCRELITPPATAREQCRVVNRVLFHECGFHGNVEHYTDPRNSLLDQVLARRKGLPLSLGAVYLLVAERLGLELEGLGLPGHFLVGCYTEGAPFFVDPFARGTFLEAEHVYSFLHASRIVPQSTDLLPTTVREILIRNCRNLTQHYLSAGETDHARLFASFIEEFDATYARHTP